MSDNGGSVQPLWSPTQSSIDTSPMSVFAAKAETISGTTFNNYVSLHRWSVDEMSDFWSLVWDDSQIIGCKGERILINAQQMQEAQFFPDAVLNFAENLLRKKGGDPAIIFRREDGLRETVSWDQLHEKVSCWQQAMQAYGVVKGDCIAAMLPNSPDTVIAMLAATSLGAIWSSCSPDFGDKAVVDRFGQIEPRLFFVCDGYYYNGKDIDLTDRISTIEAQLGADTTVVLPFMDRADVVASILSKGVTLATFIGAYRPKPVEYVAVEFSHPLYILFSSGTTGVPKCIVHSAGGTLLQHVKEHRLHCGVTEGDKTFYFTTCGWMMWNWLVSALSCGATIMLYDGSPFYPDGNVLFDYVAEEKAAVFGTSAKYIDSVRNAGLSPTKTHDLSALRLLASTGSPLASENFHYVYSDIKADVQLASISGGTDIVSCFVGGVPWRSVVAGEIQGAMLGMDVAVWDEQGRPVVGVKGELICTSPFPAMPIGFWHDESGEKYHNAYFARFDNVWCQGDFAEQTVSHGFVIHGRSDATLNPGGVRIGTAEIYNQVEQLAEVEEGLCIGQDWDNDTRVVLFVRLAKGALLTPELQQTIRRKIRSGASPRHVPAVIVAVDDLPRTKSGKIAELAVRDIVNGRVVTNQDALMNPQSLALFSNLANLI